MCRTLWASDKCGFPNQILENQRVLCLFPSHTPLSLTPLSLTLLVSFSPNSFLYSSCCLTYQARLQLYQCPNITLFLSLSPPRYFRSP